MQMADNQEDDVSDLKEIWNKWKKCWSYTVQHLFFFSSLIAVALGISVGITAKTYFNLSEVDELHIGFPGDMLMRVLQFISVLLIMTSLITEVSRLSVHTSTKIAVCAAVYFVLTTVIAVTIGMTLVLLFKPGVADVDTRRAEDEEIFSTVDIVMDLVRNIFPQKMLQACFQQYKTERLEFETHTVDPNSSLETNGTEVHLMGEYVEGANMMGLIVYSFFFGLTLKRMGEKGKILIEVFAILSDFIKDVINVILCYFPVGVLFIIASYTAEVHDWDTIYRLGKLVAVVFIGLIIHGAIVLPTLYLLFVRRNPWAFIKGASPALLTAALISSSSATLPLTLQCCEKRNKINCRICRFMLPIGTNVNMNGTTLYKVIATVFIAQLCEINLDLGHLVTIGVTAAVSSIGSARIPAAVTTLFVVAAVGLLAREAFLLVVVEWLLDHCNTFVDVQGVCIGVALVQQLSKKELAEMEEQEQDRTRAADDGDAEGLEEFYPSSSSSFGNTESNHTATEI